MSGAEGLGGGAAGGSGGDRPSFEDELSELLDRRAKRSKVDPELVGRVAARANASGQDRVGRWAAAVRSFAPARRTAASLVALVAVVALVGGAFFVAGGSRPSASPTPSPPASGRVAGPTEVTSYRVPSREFLRYLREQPDAFVGHTILVDGTLSEILGSCVNPQPLDCPGYVFLPEETDHPLVVPATQGVRDRLSNGNVSATFAIRADSRDRLTALGVVTLPPSKEAWQPSDLRSMQDVDAADLYLVDGYLDGAMAPFACPIIRAGGRSWCPPAWIRDAADRYSPRGDALIPPDGIQVPSDALDSAKGSPHPAHVLALVGRPGPCLSRLPNPPRSGECLTADPPGPAQWDLVATAMPISPRVAASVSPAQQEVMAYRFASADFLRYLREQPDAFVGHTILVDGTLTLVPQPCPLIDAFATPSPDAVVTCPPFTFGTSADGQPFVFAGSAAALTELGGPTTATFAIRVESRTRLIDLGRLTLPSSDGYWRPSDLRQLNHPAASLYPVDGFLAVSPYTYFCPLQLPAEPHWCPPAWIADTASSIPRHDEQIPPDAIHVPHESPGDLRITDLPAEGMYLVRRFVPDSKACPAPTSQSSCGEVEGWLVIGRLDTVTLSAPTSP
ncbi:MAG TPA: hypothetical protein VGK63_08455 [Candidatus Limnocylindrales bacterium]